MIDEKQYYEMQKPNLLYPNEEYINSKENINKADLVRLAHVFEDVQNVILPGGQMLDVGCNDGYFMRHFDWPFEKYVGVDMFSIYDYLRTNDISEYTKEGKITYITGLIEKIQIERKFDFIFAGEIIEHVENVSLFLKSIDNLLADKGYVCFTTPNDIGEKQAEHNRQYNIEQLKNELNNVFEIIKIEELPAINTSWPFLYAKCKKRI